MSANPVYHTWLKRIRQLRPNERITRLRSFAWMVAGILKSRHVHLRRIAEKMPGMATTNSKVRRLSRFLDNGAVRVREWYEPIARDLLARWRSKAWRSDGWQMGPRLALGTNC
jgi:hypothetical protein